MNDLLALVGADADIDRRGLGFLGTHGRILLVKND
jgi:hypothetical protein